MEVAMVTRPKLITQPLLTRKEVAQALKVSEREFDRIRKRHKFREVHVVEGAKGLRFLGADIEEYIWAHTECPEEISSQDNDKGDHLAMQQI